MIKVLISIIVEVISRILIVLKKHSRVVNQFNKLRSETHKNEDHRNLISKLLGEKKLVALDVGAQGGFYNANIFSKKYNFFFDLIAVEPIPDEAKKLENKNYKVISKGLWSENCKKKLYLLGKRPGSSSMYKPNPEVFSLYDFKEKDFPIFDITDEIDIECSARNTACLDAVTTPRPSDMIGNNAGATNMAAITIAKLSLIKPRAAINPEMIM